MKENKLSAKANRKYWSISRYCSWKPFVKYIIPYPYWSMPFVFHQLILCSGRFNFEHTHTQIKRKKDHLWASAKWAAWVLQDPHASAVPAGERGQDHLAGWPPALAALWQSDQREHPVLFLSVHAYCICMHRVRYENQQNTLQTHNPWKRGIGYIQK